MHKTGTQKLKTVKYNNVYFIVTPIACKNIQQNTYNIATLLYSRCFGRFKITTTNFPTYIFIIITFKCRQDT